MNDTYSFIFQLAHANQQKGESVKERSTNALRFNRKKHSFPYASGSTIITRDNAYKLNVKGVCRFRRMDAFDKMNWDTIRHALHPDYVQLVLRHFAARTA